MNKKQLTVYDEINTYVDKQTGEIVSTARKQVIKREKTPEFVMLFIQGLSRLTKAELTKSEGQTLSELLKYTTNNTNMLMVNQHIKKLISEDTGLKIGTVSQNIKSLATKEVIIRKSRMYFLNPLIFGRGNWEDVKKLTQTFEIEYDFINQTAVERLATKTLYEDEQNIKNLKIVGTNEQKEDKNIEQTILVEEQHKENEKKDYEIVTVETEDKNIDLIKEKNKSKELENENIRLKLELLKLEEEKKQKGIQGNLFL